MTTIFWREWLVAWRERRGFAMRCAYGYILLGFGVVAFLASVGRRLTASGSVAYWRSDQLAEFGWMFHAGVSFLQFFLASLLAAAVFARTIVAEKERRTLELLVLSPVSALEVVLGKVLAEASSAAFLLLSGVPVLCVILLMGGLAPAEILSAQLIVIAQLLFVAAVAVALAAALDRFYAVMLGTLGIVGVTVVAVELRSLPPALVAALPYGALKAELAVPGADMGLTAWPLATGAAALVLAVVGASRLLERHVRESAGRAAPLSRGGALQRALARVANLRPVRAVFSIRPRGANPLFDRECALDERFRVAWILYVAIYTAFALAGLVMPELRRGEWHLLICGFGLATAMLLVALSSALSLGGEKRDGTVEVLLASDVEPREIVEAKLAGQALRAAYLLAVPLAHLAIACWGSWREFRELPGGLELLGRVGWIAIVSAIVCVDAGVTWSIFFRGAVPAVVLSVAGVVCVTWVFVGCGFAFGAVGIAAMTAVLIPALLSSYAAKIRMLRKRALA